MGNIRDITILSIKSLFDAQSSISLSNRIFLKNNLGRTRKKNIFSVSKDLTIKECVTTFLKETGQKHGIFH